MKKPDHFLTVGPIGSRNDTTTFFRTAKGDIKLMCGCFLGTVDAFLEKVTSTHGDNKHAVSYRAAAALALAQVDTTVTDDEPPKKRSIGGVEFIQRVIDRVEIDTHNEQEEQNNA